MRVISTTVRKHTRKIKGKIRLVQKKKRDSRLGKRMKKPKRKMPPRLASGGKVQ